MQCKARLCRCAQAANSELHPLSAKLDQKLSAALAGECITDRLVCRNLSCCRHNATCNLLGMPQENHNQEPLIWVSMRGEITVCMYKQASKRASKPASKASKLVAPVSAQQS